MQESYIIKQKETLSSFNKQYVIIYVTRMGKQKENFAPKMQQVLANDLFV